uniref:Uncharacterized protein n=1 Tax=Romanomermis culicivorax TaxID=13658 RepID=A0A915K3C2_ROMCU
MQINELDDQQHRHLHRSGVPQKDENDSDLSLLDFYIIFGKHKLASNMTFAAGFSIIREILHVAIK